jgi:hypothetical protein
MRFRAPFQNVMVVGLLAAVLSLMTACNGTSGTATINSATPVPATNTPVVPTPTHTNATQCSGVAGFAGAIQAQAGMAFHDIPFPTNSISTVPALHSTGTGLFTIYLEQVCSPNTDANAVRAFFSAQMIANGWVQSPTLPFDGGYQAPCGDPYCWTYNAQAPRYVGLEKVTDLGNNLVSYQLRTFVPPPYPTCYAALTPYTLFLPQHTTVPLPPLTIFGPGDASGSLTSHHLCSAGNDDSINNFMITEVSKLGFHEGTFYPGGGATFNCGGPFKSWISPDNKYAISWNTSNGAAAGNGWSWSLQSCH